MLRFLSINESRGFTLVEALVAVAVTGIIMVSLTEVMAKVTRSMMMSQAQADIIENLNMSAEQIADDLRNIARNTSVVSAPNDYVLLGKDQDGTFETSLDVSHDDLTSDPNEHSDIIHFHALYSNDELDNRLGTSMTTNSASERVYFALWINGEGSPKPKSEMCISGYNGSSCNQGRWGIVKRRVIHTREDRDDGYFLPYYQDESKLSPLEDLNMSSTNHEGIGPLAFNVDYMSFRYYDHKNNSWEDAWDSTTKGYHPTVIEFALRGYDDRENRSNPTVDPVEPMWFRTAVSLRSGY